MDEIEQIALLNSAVVIFITESWLPSNLPDAGISIPGYNIFHKDRLRAPGCGVCVYVNQNIPCNLLEFCDQTELESIWISMRPHSLPGEVTSIVLGVIYHSTSNGEPEYIILREHIRKNLDASLVKQPNALIMLTGDLHPTSTGFKQKYITHVNNPKQLVTFKTRHSGILDWLFTNSPTLFNVTQLPKIGTPDHYSILGKPVVGAETKLKSKSKVRDLRDSAWYALGRWITQKDWTSVFEVYTCRDKFNSFSRILARPLIDFFHKKW